MHPGVDLIYVERGRDHSFILRTDRFGTGLHLRRLISPVDFAEQGSVVFQARRHIRMAKPEGHFADHQGSPVERFGFGVVALGLVNGRQVVEASALVNSVTQGRDRQQRRRDRDGKGGAAGDGVPIRNPSANGNLLAVLMVDEKPL